jgi:acetolactate synthase regulatory subunit
MKQTKISEWPTVKVNVNPATLEQIAAQAERRGFSVAAVVREALDKAYRPAQAPLKG